MLQYTPENWPYDNAARVEHESGPKEGKSSFLVAIIRPKDVSNQHTGCFKAKWMACFGEQLMCRNA